MNNQVQIFDFEQTNVRAIEINNTPYFVAKDIAYLLDVKNSRDVISTLDEDEKGVGLIDTPGGKQKMNVITESGVYAFIGASRKPAAENAKRWLRKEVLPSIRKTGAYQAQPNVPMDPMSQIQMLASSTYKVLEEVQSDMVELKSLFGLPEDLAVDLRTAVNSKVTYILGGKKSYAYESMSKKAFPAFYRNLREYFHVTSYKKIPVERFKEAMGYVNNWTPDTNLRLEINRVNAQMSLEV